MGSGLIWAGLGQGIANAGSVIGGAMMKEADLKDAREQEVLREERLLERQSALEKLREDTATRKAEREAEERSTMAQKVGERATEMASQRKEGWLNDDVAKIRAAREAAGGDSGDDVALTEEQLREALKNDPALRESYKKSGLISGTMSTGIDSRLQRAVDEEQAARDLGAKATFVEVYAKAKQDTLKQIAEENKVKRDDAARAATDRRLDLIEEGNRQRAEGDRRRGDQADRRLGIMEADARTRERRAERTSSTSDPSKKPATTADIQRQINASKDDIALTLGVTKNEVNAFLASLRKRADAGDENAKTRLEEVQPFLSELTELNAEMKQFKRPAKEGEGAAAPKPNDNSNAKSPPSYKVGETRTVASGPNKGKTAEWDGRGWVLK
jgi:hypothetical protein